MSINISDPINFTIDDSVDISLNQTQINTYLTPIYDTSTNPKFTWENNKNTGMYHPQLNTIAFSTNGSERLKIDANGNISANGDISANGNISSLGVINGNGSGLNQLNATNISSGTLAVSRGGTGKNTLTDGQFLIGSGTNAMFQTSYLTWDNSNNRLGVGITTPTSKVDISNNTTETIFKVNQLGSGDLVDLQVTNTSIFNIGSNKNINMNNNLIYTDSVNNKVGVGITQPTEKIHVLGNARIEGNLIVNGTTSIINTNIANSEQLNITNDGTGPALTINQKGNEAIIEIQDDSETCFKIFDGGHLGIGTSTKLVTTDISGNLNVSQTIKSTNVNTASASITTILNANMIDISNNSTSTALKVNQNGSGNLIDLQDNGVSKFKIDASGNITTSTFYIDASTNFVGIGTTQPNKKLHITGDTRIEGNLIVNGTLTQIDTNVATSEQLLITNDGTGPALIINQKGAQPILEIQDDNATCFRILDGGHIAIGTATKIVNVDISGNIITSGNITLSGTITSTGAITSSSTITSTGAISSSNFITAQGSGANANTGNTRIGNVVNWSGSVHPTIGSGGTTSLIMLDNPHITYRTDNMFIGRTFRASIRCAANSTYTNYWDCGATGYGFEILNGTLNTASTSCMTINNSGNVGIGNTAPFAPLCIGNSSLTNNDGFIVFEKSTTGGSSRNFRLGLNSNFDFVIGDYGGGNAAGTWKEQVKISYIAPANSLIIDSAGNTTVKNVLYVGGTNDNSIIYMGGGAAGDGGYDHSVIETRNYASTERTELLLFKGNDADSGSGPDRIRLRAAALAFDTYPTATVARATESIRMYIDQNGNVGINTVTPREKLDVYGSNIVIRSISNSTNSNLYFGTPNTTASDSYKSAIIAEGISNWSQSRLHLCVAGNNDNTTYAAIANARLSITPDGNVGIGVTRPTNILQVGNAGRLRISNNNTDYTLIGTIDTDASNNSKIVISGDGRIDKEGNVEYYSTSTGSHIWYTTNTISEQMRISSSGNIGIGETNPQYKLDIVGDINLNGNIRINGLPYVNSVLVTPSYYSLFDRITGPSTMTPNYTFTSSNTFTTFKAGILNISYSGDVKSVNIGLINATISIINILTSAVVYTKVSSLLADQSTNNYTLPSISDNIALSAGTYYGTITFNSNTQIDNNNYQTLKVLFFPENNIANGLYTINTKISYIFHKLNGLYNLPPDNTQSYFTVMNNVLGNVIISNGSTQINGYTIPKGYQIWTVGISGTFTIIAGGASGASYGTYKGGRGAVISTEYNLVAGDKIIIAIGQKPKNQSSGGGGTFITKYTGSGVFSTMSQHDVILVAGGGGGAGSGIVPGPNNVLDYLPGIDASFTTSGTRYNYKNSTYSSSTVAIDGAGGGGNGTAGGNFQFPNGIDATQTSSGCGGGGFVGTGGDVDSTCTGGFSFLSGGIPGDNTWAGPTSTGAGFGGGGAGWYSGGGGGGYSGGQGANYNEQTGGGGGGSYDVSTATNNSIPYTLWLASSAFPPSSFVTDGYNVGDGFVLIEFDTGQILGSKEDFEAKPFYSWFDDIDTGMYHPIADNIGLSTNGTEKLRIDQSGNVGIGITNPLYKLDISGNNGQDNVKMNGNLILSTDGSSNYIKCGGIMSNQNGTLTNFTSVTNSTGLCFVNNGSLALISNSGERMRVDNSGNIGIGTTLPTYKLQIGDNTNSNQIIATTNIHLTNNYFDNGAWGVRIAGIDNNVNGHNFKVLTRNSPYASFVESFTVTSSGNIGIGTVNPGNILQIGNAGRLRIANGISDYTLIGTADSDGANNTRIVISGNTRGGYSGHLEYIATNTGAHIWYTGGSSERMRLNSSGFLGIGTNSPNASLQLANIVSYRRLVLFEAANNDHQIVGLGSNGGLTFQNPNTSDSFQFRAGTSASASTELMRITGSGQLLIGTTVAQSASYKLQVEDSSVFIGDSTNTGVTANTSNGFRLVFDNTYNTVVGSGMAANKIVLHNNLNNWVGGFGIETGSVTYHTGPSSNHTFYSGSNGVSYGTLNMIITSTSRVGIGKIPAVQLDVSGGIAFSGTITGNGSGLSTLNATNLSSGIVAVSRGGTGLGTLTSNQLLVGNGTNSLLQSSNLSWNNTSNTLSATNFIGSGSGLTTLNVSNISLGTLNVSYGGTGVTTLAANQILIGNGTSTMLQSANLSWNNTSNTLSATNFVGSGTALTGLNANNITTGTISVITGGTGLGTLSAGQLLIGNGTGSLLQTTNLSWNNISNILTATNFVGSGTGLTAINASNLTSGVINASYGGTGKTSLNTNQILIGNGTGAMLQSTNLTWDNSSNILSATNFIGSGAGITTLNSSNITSGTLSVSRGGIGATTLVANQILIGNGVNALLQSSNLSWNNTSNTLSATNFVGSGAGLSTLNASNISSGILPVTQGGTGTTTSIGNGSLVLSNAATMTNGTFSGTGAGLTTLNAANISSGTLAVTRGGTGVTLSTGNGSLVLSNAATLTNCTFSGTGTGLSALNASNISSGTLAVLQGGTGTTTVTGSGSVVLSNAATMTNGTFSGTGTGLTTLNASNISLGTLAVLQGGSGTTTSVGNGSLVLSNAATMTNGVFSGTGTGLTTLNATNITLGTLAVLRGGTGTNTATGSGSVVLSNAATMTNGTFSGTGTGLTALNASNISSGTLAVARGGTGVTTSTGNGSLVLSNAATMTNGTFSGTGTGLTALNATNISSGTLAVAQGGTGLNTITNNKLLIGNGTNNIIQSNNLHWDNTNNRLGINVTTPTNELDVSGNVKVLGHIIPATNITYDLGSSTNRWRDLYISGNSININNLLLKNTDGNLQLVDTLGNAKKLVLSELEFFDGTEKIVLTKNVSGKMVLVRKDLLNNVLETTSISTADLATVSQLGIGVTQLNATLDILSTNSNNGLLLNHTNASGNIINIQKNGTTKLKIDNSGNLFASSALYVDTSNNFVGIGVTNTNTSYNLHVNGNARIEGNLSINGTTTTVNTTIQNTDQLSITNNGTAPTIIANQTGARSIVDFRRNNNTVFEIFSNGNIGIGKTTSNVDVDISGNLTVSGNINGSGSKLNNINANNVSTGLLSVLYGGTGVTSSTGYGSTVLNTNPIITNGIFSGTGNGLSNLNADNVNSGKLSVLYGGTGVNSSTGSGSVVLNTNPVITNGTFSGTGSGLTSLNASNINSGTLTAINGGTGCTSLNTTFFDTTGNILSLKSSILNTWTKSGNNIYYDIGNIAIGKTNPIEALDVLGNITLTGSVKSNSLVTNTNLLFDNVVGSAWQVDILNNTLNFKNNNGGTFNNKLTLTNTGNINVIGTITGNGSGLSSLSATNISTGILNVSNGGTGLNSISTNKLLVGNGTNQILQPSNLHWDFSNNRLGIGVTNPTTTLDVAGNITTSGIFIGSGNSLTNLNVSNVTQGTLSVSRGGIGTTTLISEQILIGNGINAPLQSSNLTWNNTTNILTATNFVGSGTGLSTLNASNITSGTLSVSRGGIGTTTLVSEQILIGNAGNAPLQTPNLTWNNTTNTLAATNFIGSGTGLTLLNASNITSGILPVSYGGTGLTSITNNKILVGNGSNTLLQPSNLHWDNTNSRLGIGTTIPTSTLDVSGNLNVLGNISGSGSSLTNLNSSNINTGTLSINYGGTGVSSFISNQILIGNGTNNLLQTSNLTWNSNSLGIGKTNPSEILDVSGNILSSGIVRANNGLITSKDLLFNNVVGSAWQIDISNNSLNFKNDNGGSFNNKLILSNTGNVNVIGIISGNGSGLSTLNVNNVTTGILNVSRGGTGLTTITSNKILVGNGTSELIQASNLHWDNINNRLGIGTINPITTLDVSGNITALNNIFAGAFIGSGASLTNLNTSNVSTGTLTALYGGTGCTSLNTTHFDTVGNILKIKDTLASKWTSSGTTINYNTGNIGIGITNPIGKLDISHNSTDVALKVNQIGSGDLIDLQDNGVTKFKIDSLGNITANILYLDTNNNVGIGTTQPSKQLHVINESQFDNKMTINGDISHNKRLTITNSVFGPALLINQIGSHPIIELQNNSVTTFKILDTGDVAIGTSTKTINVDISGNIKASNVIRSNLFYVGNESNPYGILRVYNNNNENCVLFINDTSRTIDGGSKTATLRNDAGALRLRSNSDKGLTIDTTGNVTCDTSIIINGTGTHANWGNTKIGNAINWNNLSYPTIGSNGSGGVIVIENPYIPYKTNDVFINRTFRAGIRCAADISYNAYWDCGATNNGFEILNSGLVDSCITIKSNGNIGIGKTNPTNTLDISGNINLSGIITGLGSGLNNLNASNINSGILSVVNGGTGLTSINVGNILIGNGTNTLFQTNNLIWSNNSLGIGKSNPTSTLDVSGNITASGIITGTGSGLFALNASSITSGNLSASYGGTGCTVLNTLFFDTTGGILSVKSRAFNPWEILGTDLNYDIGNVGIGKTNPSTTLDVSGNIKASGNIIGNINATNVNSGILSITNGGTGCSSLSNTFFDTTGGVLALKAGAASQWINNGNKLYYDTGNVGIGNTNPQFAMDVSGNINFTGSLYKDGSQYISSQWTTNNSNIYFNSGQVAIGKTDPTSVLDISGNVIVNGTINATGDIIANYSDDRLKNRIGNINNSLEIINQLTAFRYRPNEKALELGITNEDINIGLSAQDVQKVLPEIIGMSPLDIIEKDGEFISKTGENYLTIKYERLVPILVENIKDLHKIINQQSEKIKLQDKSIKELEIKMTKILNYINV